jgi:long-chain acyl-CoA synthetase
VNLAATLLSAAATTPDAPALHGPRGTTSYGELAGLVASVAERLRAEGVSEGDRVALVAPNSVEFAVGYLAALSRGAVSVPLNPAAPAAELDREVAAVEPRAALVAGHDGIAGVPAVALELTGSAAATSGAAPGAPAADPVARADDDLAVLLFTAGTAGAPRAAMLTHGNLGANIRQVLDHPGLRIAAADVSLGALPLFHVFGLNVVLGVGLAAGASVALVEQFDATRTVDIVRRHGVTVLAGVPTMYAAWLSLDDVTAPGGSFRTVRLAVSGAAALPRETADAFRARFGVVVHEGYGLTEAAPIVSTTATGPEVLQPGSIGAPLPGVEVRVVDADGADVLAGDPGEIWVRGPNVFAGYWHADEATRAVFSDDGWLRTGDVAVVDDAGELHLVDRVKDLVIVSGFNVYPAEVEQVLMEHPGVAEAAVVGEPSERTGETVVAYVVAVPGAALTTDMLSEHCRASLARYKCPTRIEIVDQLPHTLVGKLARRALRSPAS